MEDFSTHTLSSHKYGDGSDNHEFDFEIKKMTEDADAILESIRAASLTPQSDKGKPVKNMKLLLKQQKQQDRKKAVAGTATAPTVTAAPPSHTTTATTTATTTTTTTATATSAVRASDVFHPNVVSDAPTDDDDDDDEDDDTMGEESLMTDDDMTDDGSLPEDVRNRLAAELIAAESVFNDPTKTLEEKITTIPLPQKALLDDTENEQQTKEAARPIRSTMEPTQHTTKAAPSVLDWVIFAATTLLWAGILMAYKLLTKGGVKLLDEEGVMDLSNLAKHLTGGASL